ncbi:hypothetical protein LXA43DRAFT_895337, partial [Ganoderma leucocontextum]
GENRALTFEPSNLTALVGEQIMFQFTTENHTATQSSFADPCLSLSQTSTIGQVGFDSGFTYDMLQHARDGERERLPTFMITVNDPVPIWVYCKQTNSKSRCQSGMIFAVNAPATSNTFSTFLQNAMGSSTGTSGSSASASSMNVVSVSTGTVTAILKPTNSGATSSGRTGTLLALSAVSLAHDRSLSCSLFRWRRRRYNSNSATAYLAGRRTPCGSDLCSTRLH